MKLTLCPNSIN